MATAEQIGQAADTKTTVGPKPANSAPEPDEREDDLEVSFDDDDFDLEIVDDRPPEDRREPADPEARERAHAETQLTDDELKALSDKAQKRINQLKFEYHEERRAREAAERMAREAAEHTKRLVRDRQRAQGLLGETQKALTTVAQKRAEAAIKAAEERLEMAYESGDPKAIAAATKELNKATMAEVWAPSTARQVAQKWTESNPEEDDETESSTKEQEFSVPEPDPKAVQWQERNPWFHQDPEMTSFAYGVHERLIREGVAPDTDEYYAGIDQRMREVFPDRFEDGQATNTKNVETSSQATARAETVVAPATRNNGAKPRKVTLTATQVRLAKRIGLTPKQYAAQLLKEQQG